MKNKIALLFLDPNYTFFLTEYDEESIQHQAGGGGGGGEATSHKFSSGCAGPLCPLSMHLFKEYVRTVATYSENMRNIQILIWA